MDDIAWGAVIHFVAGDKPPPYVRAKVGRGFIPRRTPHCSRSLVSPLPCRTTTGSGPVRSMTDDGSFAL